MQSKVYNHPKSYERHKVQNLPGLRKNVLNRKQLWTTSKYYNALEARLKSLIMHKKQNMHEE